MKSPEMIDDKERRWQEVLVKIESIADGLGHTIDEGIKEGVAALMLLGIHTVGSCEGHEDWGTGGPYLDIRSDEAEALYEELDRCGDEEVEEIGLRAEEIRKQITIKNLEERRKIIPLLEAFYNERKVPQETRLVIQSLALGWSRVESFGVNLQERETDQEEKKKRLQSFQKEMMEFSNFLKGKFFSN